MSRTLKLTIAYDGTDFAGWQRQATDRTVQATIEDALAPIEGQRAVVFGAGRTDAGVHAAAQVASVTITATIASDALQRALNATLPEDVRILSIEEMPSRFHAQFAATRKTYHYWIWSGGVVLPQLRRFVWHVPQILDSEAMHAAAAFVLGEHDFAAFQAAGGDVRTTVRLITTSDVSVVDLPGHDPEGRGPGFSAAASGTLIRYEIAGSGFLRHMVRTIVGTLVEVGRGRRPADDLGRVLASRDRSQAAATAPPQGLVFWSVEY